MGLAVVLVVTAPARADTRLQIRIAWGDGAIRQWSGGISLSEGQLWLHRPLGIEADEPGSIWSDGSRVEIRQRSPRRYDGADVFVDAPLNAKLLVSMSADPGDQPFRQEIKLADLVQKPFTRTLDEHGNRLLLRRAPGDMLQVRLPGDSLVFSPGERLTLDLKPHLLPVSAGAQVRLRVRLIAKRTGEEQWSAVHDVSAAADGNTSPAVVPLSLALPQAEGVYDLLIEASERHPLRWVKPMASRHVQLIVIDDRAPAPAAEERIPWTKVLEIDPANPGWTDRLKNWPLLPGWRRGPLGNGHTRTIQHPLGQIVQLDTTARLDDTAWEAYPLSVNQPGTPHALEIEFPSDVAQSLGISILEPNAAGGVTPIGLDSGFYLADEAVASPPEWRKHRLFFWPRTKSPLLLMTNRRLGAGAVYGKIRVLAGPPRLPPAFHSAFDRSERLFAAYLDRPLFCENFGAAESLDAWSGRSLDDWQTFYEGATRLCEYLKHVGYNGLMVAVLADGSTLYPSDLLEPTPQYDTGAFFDTGQDPYRKDVLELLLRLFDRDGQRLIPALQFCTPLPALEAMLREEDPQITGVALVGADGQSWSASHSARRGRAPYYNPLNPRVQEAMLAVIREVVTRYGHHSSFGGLAVELSADGYAQLPGEDWGLDDATIAAFERDTKERVPGMGPGRFAQRARYLCGEARPGWLAWRAAKLAEFHERLQREMTAVRPDAVFYLAATNILDTPQVRRDLRPELPSRGRVDEALLSMGIRGANYRDRAGLVILRPQRIAPPGPIVAHGVEMELDRAADLDRLAAGSSSPGSLLVHEPQKLRLSSFDAKSPFGRDKTYAWLLAQLSPAGTWNRQRFVTSLTRPDLDSLAIFDGGWLLPMGQEGSLASLVAAYRRLPAEPFETLDCDRPVTVRALARDGRLYAYFVNDSPWPVTLNMQVQLPAGVRADDLSGVRRLPPIVGNRWTLSLEPFDLIAVRFGSKDVQLSQFTVRPPDEVRLGLQRTIEDLRRRRAVLENPPPFAGLKNAGFETSARGEPAHWTLTAAPQSGAVARLDRQLPFEGESSLRFISDGAGASLRSETFAPPTTGRLWLSVRLRVSDPDQQPTLRLAIEGTHLDSPYTPYAVIDAASNVAPIPHTWSEPYILKIQDVPATGLSPLCVRFDLVGAGEVWIDDVQLWHLQFEESERRQLAALLELPALQLKKGKLGDCQRELETYWPRFVAANVPLSLPIAGTTKQGSDGSDEKQTPRTGVMERVRDWWKR
jgi:hypothetical protein